MPFPRLPALQARRPSHLEGQRGLICKSDIPIDMIFLLMYFEHMRRYAFILLFLALVIASPACPADTEYIGIIPFYAPEKIWNLYTPLIDYLNKSTDIKWALKLYHDHEETIEGLCKGEISIALLGPVPFSRAQSKCGVKPLLVALERDGKPYYRSILITTDFAVKSLSDLRGKEFGFLEGSTAAYVLPRKMLEEEGITMGMPKPIFLK